MDEVKRQRLRELAERLERSGGGCGAHLAEMFREIAAGEWEEDALLVAALCVSAEQELQKMLSPMVTCAGILRAAAAMLEGRE